MNSNELDEQTIDDLENLLKDLSTPEKWAIVEVPMAVPPVIEQAFGYKGTRRYVAFYVCLRTFNFGCDDGEFRASDIGVWREFTSHPLVACMLDYPTREGCWLMLDRCARRLYVGLPTKVRLFLDINVDEEGIPAPHGVADPLELQDQFVAWLDTELAQPAAQYRLGRWHEKYDRYDDAMTAYEQAARLDANLASSAEFHCRLAHLHFRHERRPDAIRTFERALELQPDIGAALQGLGLALIGEGRIEDAIARLRRHTEVQPESAESHSSLGMVLGMSSRYSEAVQAYTEAARLDPNDVDIRSDLAAMYALAGDLGAAFREYRVARRLGLAKDKERELWKLL
jgi:tetratricopeptide (TPR) repeat protein